MEIICGTFATGNYKKDSIPYSDTASWVMIFDHNLKFKTDPVYMFNKKNNTDICLIENNNTNYILATLNLKDSLKLNPKYKVIDAKGQVIHSDSIVLDEFPVKEFGLIAIERPTKRSTDLLLMTFDGNFYKLDENLQPVFVRKLKNVRYPRLIARIDLTNDGKDEQIYQLGATDEFLFIDPGIKHISRIHLSGITGGMRHYGIIEKKGEFPLFYYQTGDKVFKILYKQNPVWNFRFLIWALILSCTHLILWVLQSIQKQRIKARLQTQRQMREMQFKIITSQLNPHFTFNALNSISGSLYDPEKPELYDRFINFSRLIRATLTDADKVTRTLEEELKFTSDFLEIQRFRHKELFDYSIVVDENISKQIQVPKMIIQLFAENAVKHGFSGINRTGLLEIMISENADYINIVIIDNGIGRKEAELQKKVRNSESTGLGIKTMQDFTGLLNRNNHYKINFTITDLHKETEDTGTKVEIKIPVRFNYQFSV